MKRVVFLRSNPVAPDPRVEKEAQALYQAGYNITIVGWDRFGNVEKNEQTDYGRIERIRIPAGFGNGLKNLPQMVKWQLALFNWLIRNDYDIIHSCDFDTVLPAYVVGKIKKVKVVYDIFDFYADMINNTPNLLKKIIKKLDCFIINSVDAVIIADDSRKEQIKGVRPKLLEVIYNSPRDIDYYDIKSNGQKKRGFTISYVGVLQPDRGLVEMIEVVSKHPDWSMGIAGFGLEEARVQKLAEKYNNITFYGRVDYETAIKLSNKADVLFATYNPGIPNNRYASPNKLFEAMMLGKPIIVSDNTNIAEIVRKTNNGIVVKYGNVTEIENALLKIKNDISKRKELALNSRSAYEQKYNWKFMQDRLTSLYSQILSY